MKFEFSQQIFEKFSKIKFNVCPLGAEEKKEPTDDTSIDVYSQQVNSTCFGHNDARNMLS